MYLVFSNEEKFNYRGMIDGDIKTYSFLHIPEGPKWHDPEHPPRDPVVARTPYPWCRESPGFRSIPRRTAIFQHFRQKHRSCNWGSGQHTSCSLEHHVHPLFRRSTHGESKKYSQFFNFSLATNCNWLLHSTSVILKLKFQFFDFNHFNKSSKVKSVFE